MKRTAWNAWGLAALIGLLLVLAWVVPSDDNADFFVRLFKRRLDGGRLAGGPEMRAPAAVPLPRRYIERTRAEVARRLAASDWKDLSREEKERQLLQILYVSGIDAEYWSMPDDRQRRVASAYVRAFLDPH